MSNRRILLVDDNPAIHEDFRKILGRPARADELDSLEAEIFGGPRQTAVPSGYELTSAHQGQEGLEIVRRALARGAPFAMAFVDMRMPPGWDGIETIQHLWAEQPDLEIVICTAYSDHSWDEIVTRLDRKDQLLILKKPFDTIEVLQLAQALTEKWSLRQQAELTRADLERHLEEEIARRERSEHELRQAQKLEAIGRLAAGVAHEINTPVQFISDSCYFLRDAVGDLGQTIAAYRGLCAAAGRTPELAAARAEIDAIERERDLVYLLDNVPRAVDRVLDGAQRIATIVRALREFAHPGKEKMVAIDLNHAVESTLTIARSEYKDVAELETDLGALPPVVCSAGEIGQTLVNIVVNAAQAIADRVKDTGERGRIRVSTRRDGDCAVVAISDTGPGIPEAFRGRIFDPFFTSKEVGRGTGQGLAIARSIVVEKHGGTLTFATEMGVGTTFHVRLPIAGPQRKAPITA